MSPWDAVAAVPRERYCPVLFPTGHMDERLERECAEKSIPYLMAPLLRRRGKLSFPDQVAAMTTIRPRES